MDSSQNATSQRVDAYLAEARPLESGDLHHLHQLAVSVFWPHRARDLRLLMSLGQGYLALDEIERVLASGMYFEMGTDFAMIGMMMTAPRLQTRGAGRWLLDRILADCAGRDLRLNATRQAYRLYASVGFVPVVTVHQRQGPVRAEGVPETPTAYPVRALQDDDAPALRALDRVAFGAERRDVLEALFTVSEGTVAVRDGTPAGFALIRDFGRGRVIGPVVAEDEAMAMALIAPLIRRHPGRFLRIDTSCDSRVFVDFLTAAGLHEYDTVTQMRLGKQRGGDGHVQTFGLAAHTLG
ncbi:MULTISPECIES: GNAT family N-acetyltransferase [unclassified Modicisalibacter]|uniref:GNAT family N-acetyltransferase n=1 Tax=unclassified Modicisalibacter TaxID=2679913 RepID=UPI001CC90F79|nr:MULTISPECIES: GNAT family N-acetyltransferase [unclassified Modicisalibacter]MBZ9558563.1 GNAT family N-acetyltransferase [Modicisalibacter sp. R2A 31.J]MBZ9575545.1 GNAT family N-acetyltransferase [Modicisalibacter sp. MOD 31.J]